MAEMATLASKWLNSVSQGKVRDTQCELIERTQGNFKAK